MASHMPCLGLKVCLFGRLWTAIQGVMLGVNTRRCASLIEFSGGGDPPGEIGGEIVGENTSWNLDRQLDTGNGEMTCSRRKLKFFLSYALYGSIDSLPSSIRDF